VTPERWQRIKEVFQSATSRAPGDRDAWLAAETDGDPQLRHEVEKMLRHAGGTGLLDRPAWEGLRLEPALEAGTHLGPYEILEEAGAGGMGRVYKARDTRLGRTVAIKVLSAEFSDRLQFEARAVSALNHPHVCALYDIGSQDGAAYLVMEYVEGESLAACLARGPLALDDVLRYGAEIAGALAAAHAQGIVHRDLKPANIMITASGAKVLDFGVARMAQEDGASSGVIVGTAAYMSPSQWNGSPADARSDIYALGLVLCEMMTGTRRLTRLASVPQAFSGLVERCLQPDAARRVQRMEEIQLALERMRSRPAAPLSGIRAKSALIAALLAIVTGTAVLTWKLTSSSVPAEPVAHMAAPVVSSAPVAQEPAPPAQASSPAPAIPVARRVKPHPTLGPPFLQTLVSYPGLERDPAFSPDGTKVAFAWQRASRQGFSICVKPVNSEDAPTILTDGLYEDWGPAWSPDGRKIAFRRKSKESGIYWVGQDGGPENFVAPIAPQDQETLPQLSWSRDGKWIAAPDRDAGGSTHINLLSLRSDEIRKLTSNPTGIDHAPAFSPDGKSLAYASCRHSVSPCDIYILDLGRGLEPRQQRRITDQGIYVRGIAWAPDGRSLVYSAGRNKSQDTYLWRVATDPPGLPERIDMAGSHVRHPAVAASTNLLAYTGLTNWKLMMIRNFR
jgi:serine/threonine protein kinase/Tol biopolymer transport system component